MRTVPLPRHTPVSRMPSATSLRPFLVLNPACRIAAMKLVALGSMMNVGGLLSPCTKSAMSAT